MRTHSQHCFNLLTFSEPAKNNTSFIQVESYIPGREYAVEGIVTDGKLQILAMFDKPDPLDGPFFEETICTNSVSRLRPRFRMPSSQAHGTAYARSD